MVSLRYSELVCQVTLHCVLCVNFSGIFSKCLQVCLAIFLKTEKADLKECVSVKFCFLLGKTAVETVTMLKEDAKDKYMSKHKCMSGLIISKEMKCLLKANHIVAPIPRAEMMNMLKSSSGCPYRMLSDH